MEQWPSLGSLDMHTPVVCTESRLCLPHCGVSELKREEGRVTIAPDQPGKQENLCDIKAWNAIALARGGNPGCERGS